MASEERNGGEEKTDGGEGESVGFTDAEESGFEEASKGERERGADDKTGERQPKALAENSGPNLSVTLDSGRPLWLDLALSLLCGQFSVSSLLLC
jgi:hypothetical protein